MSFFEKNKGLCIGAAGSRDLMMWVGETLGKQSDTRIREELQGRFLAEVRKFLKLTNKMDILIQNTSVIHRFRQ